MPDFELQCSSVRFVKGDMDALRRLHPTMQPTVIVRDLVHRYIRAELSRRGGLLPESVRAAQSHETAGPGELPSL